MPYSRFAIQHIYSGYIVSAYNDSAMAHAPPPQRADICIDATESRRRHARQKRGTTRDATRTPNASARRAKLFSRPFHPFLDDGQLDLFDLRALRFTPGIILDTLGNNIGTGVYLAALISNVLPRRCLRSNERLPRPAQRRCRAHVLVHHPHSRS